MDPNATLQTIDSALYAGDNVEVVRACIALMNWIKQGGFEPEWIKFPEAAAVYDDFVDVDE